MKRKGYKPCYHGVMTTVSPASAGLEKALDVLKQATPFRPEVAVILGSGLGPLADEIEQVASLPFKDIPGFTASSAPGHAGRMVFGTLAGKNVVALQGRVHYYEGISAAQNVFPVQTMHALGAQSLLVSNACGGLNPAWQAGDVMLQLDFINFTGDNPLIGENDPAGERFPVMFDCYDPGYQEGARAVARALDIPLKEGVYLAISGPSYATRAELRMFRAWGADAVGMSTVFEVIKARHLGMRVLGLSVVTDMAIADRNEHATGDEVVAMAERSGAAFRRLVKGILENI